MSARRYSPSEEPPIPDVSRCTKNTKAGTRCRRSRIGWPRNAELPNPQACHIHLTSEERQFDTAERERFWRTLEPHMEMRSALMASDPACWSASSLPTTLRKAGRAGSADSGTGPEQA